MDMILLGVNILFDPMVFSLLLLGVFLGMIIGSIPGLNENITFAMFLPFSFSFEPTYSLALMIGIYCATVVGGCVPAIMIKIPGTASSVLTSIDGNAMAKKGKASLALSIAIYSSVIGGLASSIILLMFTPVLSKFALRFGYVENFSLMLLGLCAVVGMLGKNYIKGILAALIGLAVSLVGFVPETGMPRFTGGSIFLYEGVPFVPILVGLFGVSAVLELVEEIFKEKNKKNKILIPKLEGSLLLPFKYFKKLWRIWVSSAFIGNLIGVLPGAGMIMAIYLAYNRAASRYQNKFAKDKNLTEWGKGVPEGIAAAETANNSVVASSMVPLLSLGIPGNSVSALFIGALMLNGMTPGPLLFKNFPDIAYMIIVSFLIANIFMTPIAILCVRYVSGLIYKVPKIHLVCIVILFCLTGSYADGNSIFNIWVALISGVIGYLFNKCSLPQAPILLGLVLGKKFEENLISSLNLSDGSLFIFVDIVNYPISFILVTASLLFLIVPQIKRFL